MSITSLPTGPTGPTGVTGPAGATGATGATGLTGWTTISKSSDQAIINSTTLTDDTVLTFAMAATTKYRIRGCIWIDPTAAGDYKYAWTTPSSPTLIRITNFSNVGGGGSTGYGSNPVINSSMPSGSQTSASANLCILKFDGIFHNLNSGNLTFQFAQNSAVNDAGAICRAGSYIEYKIA